MQDVLFSLRRLKRNKLLLYVGIPGLAIGLTVVLLLICYVRREYSFDKHFATKNRVVRLYVKTKAESMAHLALLHVNHTTKCRQKWQKWKLQRKYSMTA